MPYVHEVTKKKINLTCAVKQKKKTDVHISNLKKKQKKCVKFNKN